MNGLLRAMFSLRKLLPELAAAGVLFAAYGFSEGVALTLLSGHSFYAILAFFLITALFSNFFAKYVTALARRL